MRILVTTTTFPRWQGDSQAPFVFYLCRELVRLGHEVRVIAPHANGAQFREELDGVTVVRFRYCMPARFQTLCYGAGMLPNFRASFAAKLQVPLFGAAQQYRTITEAHSFRPHIIHAHWLVPQGLVIAPIRRALLAPIYMTAHGSDVFSFSQGRKKKLVAYAAGSAARISTNSSATRHALHEICGVDSAVIPMGVDDRMFADDACVRDFGDAPQLLAIGRLIELKGHAYAIAAMPKVLRQYPSACLHIVGKGPLRQALEQQARELGVWSHVQFVDGVPADEMYAYMRAKDLLLFPSVEMDDGGREALGLVGLEAFAAGLPVVAANAGGVVDFVMHDKTGILAPQRDADALAQAALNVLGSPVLGRRLAANARQLAREQYTWRAVAERFVADYRQIVGTAQ